MSTVTLRTGGLSIDTRDFHAFAVALSHGERELNLAMRRRFRAAGNMVADAARAKASYSEKIDPTIRVRTSRASVSVIAGPVAIAGLEELGNRAGRGSRGGFFRHPVFGNRNVWVSQRMRPYLRPALEARGAEAAEEIFKALDDAIAAVIATPNP